jgi:undecaprenyl-diphosphatase
MDFVELLKAAFFGLVEGVTEWLPISSTGHMILVDEFLSLNVSDAFLEMFLVVIQLGAILAVIVLFWDKLWPFSLGKEKIRWDVFSMWFKVVVACIPAAVAGLLWDDVFTRLFYNYQTVAIMLILFGVLFLLIERKERPVRIQSIEGITYRTAVIIGLFQLIAAIFPGTSRSGATIVGAMLLGVSRATAAEFTFFLAVPVMFGASALKMVGFGLSFNAGELSILLVGMVVAFVVSMISIRFLMNYIKKHSFRVFGWYRIILGAVILIYFALNS